MNRNKTIFFILREIKVIQIYIILRNNFFNETISPRDEKPNSMIFEFNEVLAFTKN
tara:strand:+ start:1202 stop:1369 length:168 start_codon:yes stop_codon:yes gene_type:complete